MNRSTLTVCTILLATSSAAWADHNSPWGPGWANMPNDIHNTRVDTRESGDNDTFRDFVRFGAGADSVNRCLDGDCDDTDPIELIEPAAPPVAPAAPAAPSPPRRSK